MAFDITEIINVVRRASKEEIELLAADADKCSKFPREVVKLFSELGLYKLILPESFGGYGLSTGDLCEVTEELAAVCAGAASIFSVNALGLYTLSTFMKAKQFNNLDKGYLNGEKLIGYAMTGSNYSGDSDSPMPICIETEDSFTLSGKCRFTLLGGIAEAYIVSAEKSEDAESDKHTLFFIGKDRKGVHLSEQSETLGLRALPVAELTLDNCVISKENVIGEMGNANKILSRAESFIRLLTAANSIGLIRRAFELAKKYGEVREQFGQKIGTFHAIQDMFVSMEVSISAGKNLVKNAAAIFEDTSEDPVSICAQAKLFCTDSAMSAAENSVQVYGGFGYMRDFPVEKLMRDAKMLQLLFGNPSHLKNIIAGHM